MNNKISPSLWKMFFESWPTDEDLNDESKIMKYNFCESIVEMCIEEDGLSVCSSSDSKSSDSESSDSESSDSKSSDSESSDLEDDNDDDDDDMTFPFMWNELNSYQPSDKCLYDIRKLYEEEL